MLGALQICRAPCFIDGISLNIIIDRDIKL